jgi:hypothetical protein
VSLGRVSVIPVLAMLTLPTLPHIAQAQDEVPPDIAAFVRDHGDAGLRPYVVGHLDQPPLTLFATGSNVGVQAADRIGWLRQPADVWKTSRVAVAPRDQTWFDLGPDDSLIAATAVDPRLASAAGVQLRVWRTVVAQSPATTLPTLLALLQLDQTLGPAVATNPRVLDAASPLPALIALANANDQVSAVVVQNPALASHPRALATLAQAHPIIWNDAMRVVLDHLGDLTASGPIDERLAVHLAAASWMLGVDSAPALVGQLPAVRHSAMAQTIMTLATDTDHTQPARRTSETGARELIGRIYADTGAQPWLPPALGGALARARVLRGDHTLLWELAMVNGRIAHGRWREARTEALMAIASDPHSTPEELERVARALGDSSYWQHRASPSPPSRSRVPPLQQSTRDGQVAGKLLMNPRAAGSRATMELLAALPAAEFGSVPALAARRLQAMSRGQ